MDDLANQTTPAAPLEGRASEIARAFNEWSPSEKDREINRLRFALRMCAARAGLPDPLDACRAVIRTVEEALANGR